MVQQKVQVWDVLRLGGCDGYLLAMSVAKELLVMEFMFVYAWCTLLIVVVVVELQFRELESESCSL